VLAQRTTGWRVRGTKDLRTLRLPASMGLPELSSSQAVAGFASHPSGVYAHLGDDAAELVLTDTTPDAVRLVSANGRIEGFERLPNGWRWNVVAHVPVRFTLANAQACKVRVAGRDLVPTHRTGTFSFFEIKDHAARPLEALCRG